MIPIKAKGWNEFLVLCKEAESTNQLDQLFDLFFTPEEKEQLAMRVELVKELLAGKKTQRVISRDLNISIAKITRGSNALKSIDDDIKTYIKDHIDDAV